ncbi:hypothetical protein [Fodinibius sp. Rm-B-1B1-1]|uniref:hypothetical protein n=1 Tax=Fodinibius alkaliphilus TaxID=3140241 RepID=UPI003159A39B
MKKLFIIPLMAMFLALTLNNVSHAQDNNKTLGVGFMVGEPTGLTLKSWTGGGNAIDVGVAWSFGRYEAMTVQADYLWHNYDIFSDVEEGSLPLYYGIGGRLVLGENDSYIGARVPVGLNYLFEDAPVGLFIEAAPILNIAPSTDFDIDGTLGARFYF